MRVANYVGSWVEKTNLVNSSGQFARWLIPRHAHRSQAWVGWCMRQGEAERDHQQHPDGESGQQAPLHGVDFRIRKLFVDGPSFTCVRQIRILIPCAQSF